jgi:hypothetical protein
MNRFSLKKLDEVEDKEHYYVEIKNRFAALVNVGAVEDFNRAWETDRIQNLSQRQSTLL